MTRDNDRAVLRALVADPRASDAAIAKGLGLSPAGVGKIRRRLEGSGAIIGYRTDLDYEALGLGTFAIIHIRLTSEGWRYRGSTGARDSLAANPNVVAMYRVPGREVTHILVCAFRNVQEMDRFVHAIQSHLTEYVEVVETFVFAKDSIVKDASRGLLLAVLDEGADARMPEPVLFGADAESRPSGRAGGGRGAATNGAARARGQGAGGERG